VVEVQVVGSVVPIRTGLPVGCDRGHDQSRVARGELGVAEPEGLELPGRTILDEDVGVRHQLFEEPPSRRGLQVQGDGPLARVQIEEERAAFAIRNVVRERAAIARRITLVWSLQLDDVGAEVGEQLRAEGGGHHPAELDDGEPGEGAL
jgi:hypothetical protein